MSDDKSKKSKILRRIGAKKIVSVIRTDSENEAFKTIELLRAGGIEIFEVTMTVPDAPQLIKRLTNEVGDEILLGAGTVLSRDAAERCVAAGAKFIVSPIFKSEIVRFCKTANIPVFPAGLTPNEIFAAAEAGADGVKVFPANAVGGAKYLKSLKAVFPEIKLMPTGGVNLETITDFLEAGAFAVGIGSELSDVKLLRGGRENEIIERARRFVEKFENQSENRIVCRAASEK